MTSDEKLLKLIEGSAGVKPVQKLGVKPKGKGKCRKRINSRSFSIRSGFKTGRRYLVKEP